MIRKLVRLVDSTNSKSISETAEPILTGFRHLDEITGGFNPGELIVVGGRPGMGKTAFGLSLALNVACSSNRRVLFYSLEAPNSLAVQRLWAIAAKVSNTALQRNELTEVEKQTFEERKTTLEDKNIYFDDTPAITIQKIRNDTKRFTQVANLDLIVIDYLQLMKGKKGLERNAEIESIVQELKKLALDLNVPIVLLSQLGRYNTEQRTRPILTDLGFEGLIEQYADTVLFLHRESYYMDKDAEGYEEMKNRGEILIEKQRNGCCGVVPLLWNGVCSGFFDVL